MRSRTEKRSVYNKKREKMEVYVFLKNYEPNDVEAVKRKIVELLGSQQIVLDIEEILFENEVFILLINDEYFDSFEKTEFFLYMLAKIAIELTCNLCTVSVPDLDIQQTHYN